MILASLGKLSVQQTLTGTEISENVIQIAALDWAAWTDVWWVVQTTTIASVVGAMTFKLVFDTQVGLDGTQVEVMGVDIAAITDLRVATVGRFIAAFNVGKQMKQMLEEDASDYAFIGMENVCAGSTTLGINAFLSFTEPHTIPHKMTVESNIDNSIAVASAGSGSPA